MSDIRYSSGHSVASFGVFILPLIPLGVTSGWADDHGYVLGWAEVGIAWCAALLVHLALIAAHEFSHYLAARAVGIRIKEITIGHWRRIARFEKGDLSVTIRLIPDSGSVVAHPTPALGSPARRVIYAGAGLIFELVAVAAACVAIQKLPARFTNFQEFLQPFLLWSIVVFGTLHVVQNLWPGDAQVGGQRLANDGRQILDALRKPRATPAQIATLLQRGETIASLARQKEFAAATADLESLCREQPANVAALCWLANLCAENGEHERAITFLREGLDLPGRPPHDRAQLLDGLACIVLYHGLTERWGEAEAWIRSAIEYSPQAITLQGTLGALLIEQGRFDEADKILRRVLSRSEDALDQAIAQACLAKLAWLRGDYSTALASIARAKAHPNAPPFIERIAREIIPTDSAVTKFAKNEKPGV